MNQAPPRLDPRLYLTGDEAAIATTLPEPLAGYAGPIASSRAMLDLADDWDGEGSPGYAPETWGRAIGLVLRSALRLWEETGLIVTPPKIRKGPQGSIDVHWRQPNRELLVNIPIEPTEPAEFFGHDRVLDANGRFRYSLKGALDAGEEHSWLLMWLIQA